MRKLVINGRDFGEVTLHSKVEGECPGHCFTILDGQVNVMVPAEHIERYNANYNYSIRLKRSGNYMYQVIREYDNGEMEPLEGVYKKEAEAIEIARLHTKAYQTDFWKGTQYYNSKYHVVAIEY